MGFSSQLERNFRTDLRATGLKFESNCRDLPGTPDIVFRNSQLAVFIHGCYWHRHSNCVLVSSPRTSTSYWLGVFNGVVSRDMDARKRLELDGWKVVVVWECEIRQAEKSCLTKVSTIARERAWQSPVD